MKRILIIDDDIQMREMLCRGFECSRYKIEGATFSRPFELSELIETTKKRLDS